MINLCSHVTIIYTDHVIVVNCRTYWSSLLRTT